MELTEWCYTGDMASTAQTLPVGESVSVEACLASAKIIRRGLEETLCLFEKMVSQLALLPVSSKDGGIDLAVRGGSTFSELRWYPPVEQRRGR